MALRRVLATLATRTVPATRLPTVIAAPWQLPRVLALRSATDLTQPAMGRAHFSDDSSQRSTMAGEGGKGIGAPHVDAAAAHAPVKPPPPPRAAQYYATCMTGEHSSCGRRECLRVGVPAPRDGWARLGHLRASLPGPSGPLPAGKPEVYRCLMCGTLFGLLGGWCWPLYKRYVPTTDSTAFVPGVTSGPLSSLSRAADRC